MRRKQLTLNTKFNQLEDLDKQNHKIAISSNNIYTPKNARDFFASNNSKNFRHCSEQETKLTPKHSTHIFNHQTFTKHQQKQAIGQSISSMSTIFDLPYKASPRQGKIIYQAQMVNKNTPQKVYNKVPIFRPQKYSAHEKPVERNNFAFLHKMKEIKKKAVLKSGFSIDNFVSIKKLGEGKFGKVHMAIQKLSGFILAIKVISKKILNRDNILVQFIRQLKIQTYLNHPNIIKVYGFFSDEMNFYIMMELGVDGQLYEIIDQEKILSQQTTSFIVKNLLEVAKFMHQEKIIHRDIKPQNIVLVHGTVKICDFGWAVHKRQDLRSTFCGTPLYLSPQILNHEKYDQKVDLWAIGILACQLGMGCLPFQIKDKEDLIKIIKEDVRFPPDVELSKQYKHFIRTILIKDPKKRLTSIQLLNLPFIAMYSEFQTNEQLCHTNSK